MIRLEHLDLDLWAHCTIHMTCSLILFSQINYQASLWTLSSHGQKYLSVAGVNPSVTWINEQDYYWMCVWGWGRYNLLYYIWYHPPSLSFSNKIYYIIDFWTVRNCFKWENLPWLDIIWETRRLDQSFNIKNKNN